MACPGQRWVRLLWVNLFWLKIKFCPLDTQVYSSSRQLRASTRSTQDFAALAIRFSANSEFRAHSNCLLYIGSTRVRKGLESQSRVWFEWTGVTSWRPLYHTFPFNNLLTRALIIWPQMRNCCLIEVSQFFYAILYLRKTKKMPSTADNACVGEVTLPALVLS